MTIFKVRVTKDYTGFCAAHFITYEGDKCEKLHGHNYRVATSLEGRLTENAYVFDFIALKDILRRICDCLDHRVLLPRNNSLLTLTEKVDDVIVYYGKRTYTFPKEDVVILSIPNTTAEMLAQWVGNEIESALHKHDPLELTALEVEVEEAIGQHALWRKEFKIQ